ncbi:hypothetical protein C8A00DRAFT_11412 [Chaetomidium leptoderma]|uniref:Uncharacterized protein n=1 Tax=Chaetomidium leptoderma TaxID=669021 RepID=A0AAN6VWD7_9PEZI|nr:hypothetical protein C8A00DRAFT_11412 [Chaetomidium leptoderma]
MVPPQPDDQSLLDRLNALKSTGVTLETPAKVRAQSTTILPGPHAQPLSREDALAARLRILRGQPGSSSRDEGVLEYAGPAPPPTAPPTWRNRPSNENVVSQASPTSPKVTGNANNQEWASYRFVDSGADDEDALDELLEALGDEEFDLAADEDAEPPPGFDPSRESKKLAGLLEKRSAPRENTGPPEEDDDDDSDGEQMTRDVETLLAQIGDEINSLPPPSTSPADDVGAGDNDEPLFTLPTVPSQLVDPVPDTPPIPSDDDDDFEKDISARLASLRGLGPPDALGLPSAPTFRPEDHNPTTASAAGGGLLHSKSKYTDEDQRTWCVVCLEDATIRCVGCDSDVYCARCWKEMHVGPSAGYDTRGHQWVKFERSAHP